MKRKYEHEISSWMNDDHTFCLDECDYFVCWRHQSQIQDHSVPHSFAHIKGTPDCEIEIVKERSYLPDEGDK